MKKQFRNYEQLGYFFQFNQRGQVGVRALYAALKMARKVKNIEKMSFLSRFLQKKLEIAIFFGNVLRDKRNLVFPQKVSVFRS